MKNDSRPEFTEDDLPSVKAIEKELIRVKSAVDPKSYFPAAVAAVALSALLIFLLNNFLLPVMSIEGESMSPALKSGDLCLALKTADIERGDICFFNVDGETICKRVIALPGDVVSIDRYGVVSVNDEQLNEDYVDNLSLSPSDISYPYVVGDGKLFVLGDNREKSVDSRNSTIGALSVSSLESKAIFDISSFKSVN